MTSPSDEKSSIKNNDHNLMQQVHQALDQSVNGLPVNVASDIAQARKRALAQLNSTSSSPSMREHFAHWRMNITTMLSVPVAAALILALLVNYSSVNVIPVLPMAMLSMDVPNEDLALLEDLDFVMWLAENEANTLL